MWLKTAAFFKDQMLKSQLFCVCVGDNTIVLWNDWIETAYTWRNAALTHVDKGVVEKSSRREGCEGEVVVHLWVFVLQPYAHAVIRNLNLHYQTTKWSGQTYQEKEKSDLNRYLWILKGPEPFIPWPFVPGHLELLRLFSPRTGHPEMIYQWRAWVHP